MSLEQLQKDYELSQRVIQGCFEEANQHVSRRQRMSFAQTALIAYKFIEDNVQKAGQYSNYASQLRGMKSMIADILESVPDRQAGVAA